MNMAQALPGLGPGHGPKTTRPGGAFNWACEPCSIGLKKMAFPGSWLEVQSKARSRLGLEKPGSFEL